MKTTEMISQLLETHRVLMLVIFGLTCLATASTFEYTFAKVDVDNFVAEVGALFLVVGSLQFLFEMRLRRELLSEVASAVIGSERVVASGLIDWLEDSRKVSDEEHWRHSKKLTVGIQYSPKFLDDHHAIVRARCVAGLDTTVLVLKPDGDAASYLTTTRTGQANVAGNVARIRELAKEAGMETQGNVKVVEHDRVLRYSFIETEECVWIKFFTNSRGRATVPALKVKAGTPMYAFLCNDTQRLMGDEMP